MTTQKEKFKKFIESTISEVLKEMTGTGAVAGYSTPFAFTKNKNGNVDAAKSAGYSLVGETEFEKTEKEILKESVVGDPFLGRKVSSYLAETNRMLTVVEALLARKSNPKHAKLMKENSFAKRTTKDMSDIKEKFSRISEQFGKLTSRTTQKVIKEDDTPDLQRKPFSVSNGYENFENDLSALIAGYEKLFNGAMVGKEVTIRASKGYGQVKKDYKITTTSVTISLLKDEYQLIVKDRQQKDYYLDKTFKIVISGESPQQTQEKKPEAPQSPVEKQQSVQTSLPTEQPKTP